MPTYTFPKDREDLAVLRVVVRNGFSRDLADLLLEDLSCVLTRLERQSAPLHNATSAAYHHNAYRRSPSAKEVK